MKLLFQKIQSAFDNQNTHNRITLKNIETLRNLLSQQLPPEILGRVKLEVRHKPPN